MSSTNGNARKPFKVRDVPIENQRPLSVRVIGAGYSGIYLGIRIPHLLRNIDLKIYERHPAVGGTWFINRYPGCACDIPSHSYQYSFNPNPEWSSFYAPQREICAYLQGTAEKYGVMRFVELEREVVGCVWDGVRKKWVLSVRRVDSGEVVEDEADVVVCARGNLSEPSWPDIDGLHDFEGVKMHSARWEEGYS